MRSRFQFGRLVREAEFRAVHLEGRRCSTTHLVIHARPNGLPIVRVGVVVGRRVGRAVARNRLRRRLREALRSWAPVIVPGVDLVIVPRGDAGALSFGALRDEAGTALGAVGLLRDGLGGRQ